MKISSTTIGFVGATALAFAVVATNATKEDATFWNRYLEDVDVRRFRAQCIYAGVIIMMSNIYRATAVMDVLRCFRNISLSFISFFSSSP